MIRPRTTLVAYTGDLASSYLVASLAREGREVIAVTVAAGSIAPEDLGDLGARARTLGAVEHVATDGRDEAWERFLTYLVKANVLRHGTDPLWTAAEAYLVAERLTEVARGRGATDVAHAAGGPGGGDTATRLEVALHALAPDVEVAAPIREDALLPAELRGFLAEEGLLEAIRTDPTDASPGALRRRRSAWGGAALGGSLDDAKASVDDEAFEGPAPWDAADLPEEFELTFRGGVPTAGFGAPVDGVSLTARLGRLGSRHGVGRHIHLGETALGLKRRTAVEVPAAAILVEAHRALEQATLTDRQLLVKEQLALTYADLFHRGLYHEPVMRDIEAFLDASQARVAGDVRLRIYRGRVQTIAVDAISSPLAAAPTTGATELWDGRDAEGYARLLGLPTHLQRRAQQR